MSLLIPEESEIDCDFEGIRCVHAVWQASEVGTMC